MKTSKRIVSLLMVISLILGMIPMSSVMAAENNDSTEGYNYDNIPKNNVNLLFSDNYLNGTEGISSFQLVLDEYRNSDGILIEEDVIGIYGNLVYARCFSKSIQDDTLYYYLKDCHTGDIIYASETSCNPEDMNAYEIVEGVKVKQLCDLMYIRDENKKYDIINVYTGIYYDYNLYDTSGEMIDGYAAVKKEFTYNYGLIDSQGNLIADFVHSKIDRKVGNENIILINSGGVKVYNTRTKEERAFEEYSKLQFTDNQFVFGYLKQGHYPDYEQDGSIYNGRLLDAEFNLVTNEYYSEMTLVGSSVLCDKRSTLNFIVGWDRYNNDYNCDLVTETGEVVDLAKKFNCQSLYATGYAGDGLVKVCAYSAECYTSTFGYRESENHLVLDGIGGYVDLEVGFLGYLDISGNIMCDFTEEATVEPKMLVWRNGEQVPLTINVDGVPREIYRIEQSNIVSEDGVILIIRLSDEPNENGEYDKTYEIYDYNGKRLYDINANELKGKWCDFANKKFLDIADKDGDMDSVIIQNSDYLLLKNTGNISYRAYFFSTGVMTDYYKKCQTFDTEDYFCLKRDEDIFLYNRVGQVIRTLTDKDNLFVLPNGNIMISNSQEIYTYIYSQEGQLLKETNEYYVEYWPDRAGNYIIRSSEEKWGLVDENGNILIKPESSSQINYKNFIYYAIGRDVFDMYGNLVLSGTEDNYESIDWYPSMTNCGTLFAEATNYSYVNREEIYYVFWFNDKIEEHIIKKQTPKIQLIFEKSVLAINEQIVANIYDFNGNLLTYDGQYTVTSSVDGVVDIETQGTGVVSAVIRGKTIGESVITVSFDNGEKVEASIKVDLSEENILQYFPLTTVDNQYSTIFRKAMECCNQINDSYTGWDKAVASYFTCLKSGGTKVISQHILSKFGLAEDLKDEYVDSAIIALMNEMCKVDTTFTDKVSYYTGKWSTAKSHYGATNESLKEFAKYGADISDFSEEDIFKASSEILDAYGKVVKYAGKSVDIYEIMTVIIATESIQVEMVNSLLDVIEPGNDFYDGLVRLKIELTTGLVEKVVKEYIEKEIIIDVVKEIIDNKIVGMKSASKLSVALAKICVNLIVQKYQEEGGVMASDVSMALYTTTFAMQLDSALIDECIKYSQGQGKADDFERYEWIYNAYTSALCVALENCAKICKPQYSYWKDEALKYKNLIGHRCTYEMFMQDCMKEALREYPKDYSFVEDESGKMVVTGTYRPLVKTFALRTEATNNVDEILYIPADIDGKNVTAIADNAFKGNTSIKGIIIADGVEQIGNEAFADCINLEFVIMGTVSILGQNAFSNCTSLKYVTLSENIQEIKPYTFNGCTEIECITIPKSVLTVSDSAFYNTKITTLIVKGGNTVISENSGLSPEVIHSVPNESINELATIQGSSIVAKEENIVSISVSTLPKCTEFNCEDNINTQGLILEVIYESGKKEQVDADYTIDYNNEPGEQEVKVFYRDKQTSYFINLLPTCAEKIVILPLRTTMSVGEEQSLSLDVSPSNVIITDAKWLSSNEDVVRMQDNIAIAIAPGEAVITVEDLTSGKKAYLRLEVSSSEEVCFDEGQRTRLLYKKIENSGIYNFYANVSGVSISVYDMNMQILKRGYEEVTVGLTDDVVIVLNRYDKTNNSINLYTEISPYWSEWCDIVCGEEYELNTENNTGVGLYKFVPEESGVYCFYSYNNDLDTLGYLYDANMKLLRVDYGSGEGNNFRIQYTFSAGETYYLKSEPYDNDSKGSYCVKVAKAVMATSFEITNGDSISGLVNNGCNLNTKFGPENAIIENITWTSSNTDVATVSSYGYVNFVSAGTTTITATTANGLTDSIEVTVNDRPKASAMEIVNGDRITGYVGAAKNLQVRFQPDGCVYESVTWSSDNTEVATVNTNGVVTFLAEGVATITATSENGLTDTCVITVEDCETLTMEQPVKVTITNNGEEYVRFSPSEGGLLRVYISELSNSNDPDIWLYDSSMNTLAWTYDEFLDYEFEAGETYYIATNYHSWSDSGEGTYYLNVVKPVPATSISFDIGSEYRGYVGTSRSINVIYAPNHAMTETITWSSSDSSVVSVSRHGEISLNTIGTATITATSENGLVFTCTIVVEDYESIEVNQEKNVVLDGDTAAYYYFTPDEDGYYAFYSYNSEYDTYGTILNSNMEEIKSDYDGGDGNNFKVQYRLEAGVTYILKARFWNTDNKGSFKVCVEQTKCITALEIVSMPEKTEYIKDYVSGDNISYYGLKLKATWSDGSITDWEYNFDWYIDGEYISRDAFNVQETGNVKLTCGDASVTLTFTLIDNPVDHLELVSGSSYNYVENFNGYVSTNSNGEYFYYYTNFPSDAVIKIVYKDGTSTTSKVGEYIDGYRIDWSDNQYQEPWVVGTDNKSMISYLGHTVNLPITVVENKVASIEVVSGRVTCIEKSNGYEHDNGYYYHYSVPSDVVVKINYVDGTSKTVGIYDRVDGYSIRYEDDQYENPWVLGDNNYLMLSYLGVEAQLPVSVIANPVERIEINTAPTREYVYGDPEYGYVYPDGDYEFYPTDLAGLSFTVYYTDGTSKTFTYDDIDEDDTINGYGYELYYDEYNPEIGDFPVKFEYMGKSADYTVVLKETSIASITVTKQPNKATYVEQYAPDFVGMEFTITYTDGTTRDVVLSEDNLKYEYDPWWGELRYKVDVDGTQFVIEPYYGGDEFCYIAYYLGASCLIEDITFIESKEVSSIELDKVTWNGEGMTIKITYTDETSETLKMDAVYLADWDGPVDGYGKTENGFLYYYIETYLDEAGNVEKYDVRILGRDIIVEPSDVLIGDVNSDGIVDNLDRMVLSRYLADWAEYTEDIINMAAADVNQDGIVDNLDRMVLSRHLADWEGYEELPSTTE